jgi:nucleoside-diphosphate-sugar epimerase
MKQAVLGATGDVGSLLLNELISRNIDVKALSRTIPDAGKQRAGIEYAVADAEDKNSLTAATRGIDVVYATLAVPYGTEPWQRSWPIIMRNLIDAAKANGFKLVFLDNVYMYGKADGPMTEDSPIQPAAKKGEIRAEIARMLLDAMAAGEVNATVGRSADFYGANTRMSSRFFSGTLNEGKAYWMGSPDVLRTWSYVPDNARALAILGNDARADQKVWHMPAAQAMKGTDFISLAGTVLGRELETVLVPGNNPQARQDFAATMPEIAEMMYQYDFDYVFDSSRFQETFAMQPTSYEDGFRQVYDVLAQAQ